MPGRLRRIPDGETGHRSTWISFQWKLYESIPQVLDMHNPRVRAAMGLQEGNAPPPSDTRNTIEDVLKSLPELNTRYDTEAIASYGTFRRLRGEGIIPHGVRFQVSIPTPLNVIGLFIIPDFQAALESSYEAALLGALRRIQDEIPAEDLAIQWDTTCEIAMLENLMETVVLSHRRGHFRAACAYRRPRGQGC